MYYVLKLLIYKYFFPSISIMNLIFFRCIFEIKLHDAILLLHRCINKSWMNEIIESVPCFEHLASSSIMHLQKKQSSTMHHISPWFSHTIFPLGFLVRFVIHCSDAIGFVSYSHTSTRNCCNFRNRSHSIIPLSPSQCCM